MTTLVTGGGGLVGARVVRALLDARETVVALEQDTHPPRLETLAHEPRLSTVQADIRDPQAVLGVFQDFRVERVIHLAAVLAPITEREPALGFSVNITGMNNMLEAARHCAVQRVCYASSIATYADQSKYGEHAVDEHSWLEPYNLYGYAKLVNEQTAQAYTRNFGFETCGIRIAMVFGHGRLTGRSSAMSRIISSAAIGQPIESDVAREQTAPVIYVDDVARCMITAALTSKPLAPVYNSPSHAVSLAEVVAVLDTIVPASEVSFAANIATYPSIEKVDSHRIERDLGIAAPELRARITDHINEARAERQLPAIDASR